MYIIYADHVQMGNTSIPLDEGNRDYQDYLAWVAEGNTPDQPPAPTLAEVIARFTPTLQTYMDGVANQNGYDSVVSCASYKASGVTQWAADATAMIAWRDAMWVWAYGQQSTLAAMTPEEIANLTTEYIISQAPKAADYGWVVHDAGAQASSVGGTQPLTP